MKLKIDEATGLPELDEGMYWFITPTIISIVKKLPDTEWAPRIPLFVNGDTEGKVVPTGWFRRKKLYRCVNVTEPVYRRDYKWQEVTDRGNLLDRCEEVFNEWKEYKERVKLYGAYPPNRFESVE